MQGSFIQNCQNLQAIKMFFKKWMGKETMVPTQHATSEKWNELSSHEITERNLKYTLLSERIQSEKISYCMISIIWHSRKGKNTKMAKISVVPRRGIRRNEQMNEVQEILGQWNNSVWYNGGENPQSVLQKVKFNENYGLQLVIICQYWFIISNKQTTLMQDDNNRGNRRDRVKRCMRILYA